jgi:hypothetical protein
MRRGDVGKKAREAVTLHVRLDVQQHASAAANCMMAPTIE